ncbi:MAG: hypothetical protein P8Y23_18845, partial [Candidatus Lokiarchaeota archaeon]
MNTLVPQIVKFNSSGYELWNKTYEGFYIYPVTEMTIDDYDNIYMSTSSATAEDSDFLVFKINKTGDIQWSEKGGTINEERCRGIALNSTNDVYLIGYEIFYTHANLVLMKFKLAPPDPPYFINPQDEIVMYENDNSKSLVWTPKDDSMYYDSYWIIRNETKVMQGKWDGSQIIFSNLSMLDPGIYNFTCFVNNSAGKTSNSSIKVTVLQNLYTPNIYNEIEYITFGIGTSNNTIRWHAIDFDGNNNSYWIMRNDSKIKSGKWSNDSDIILSENEILNIGYYNYTCFV